MSLTGDTSTRRPAAKIVGTGSALPGQVRTNDDLARTIETSDDWIVERTGIRQRRILEAGRDTSDLAAEAAQKACDAAGIRPSELDCIICATVTPDAPLPCAAVLVQKKLGATCPAFDILAACAGFVYGLSIGESLIRGGQYRRVLVIGVEVLSRSVNWADRNTCVLFGDGAGAVVLAPSTDGRGILSTHLFADGNLASILNIPAGGTAEPTSHATVEAGRHFIQMQGRQVFAHAVKNLSHAAQVALGACGLGIGDIHLVLAHQANLRILESVSERTGMPLEKFFVNIDKYGNTSSASIPLVLDEARAAGRVRPGELGLMLALGAGLSWGSAVVRF